jgi:hypothetical protein
MITDPFDSGHAIDWLELVDYVLMRAIRKRRVESRRTVLVDYE